MATASTPIFSRMTKSFFIASKNSVYLFSIMHFVLSGMDE